MRFVSLLSGGKDSYYSLLKAIRQGHELVCLATLYSRSELDSSMFQTTGTLAVMGISKALRKPIYAAPLVGRSVEKGMVYRKTEGDEIEDLWELLTGVKYRFPEVEAVVSGAVFSNYQRLRIEDVCGRLGLVSIAPLWRLDQSILLQEQLDAGIESVIVKASSMGLNKSHLGLTVKELSPYFEELHRKFGFNVCGEGGEYETVVVDSPEFSHKIVLSESEIVADSKSDIDCSAHLKIGKVELEDKSTGLRETVGLPAESRPIPKLFKTISHFASGELTVASFSETECRSTEDEAFIVLKGAREMLKESGVKFEDVYYVHVTLQSLTDFVKFNQVYKSFFSYPGPPARCCVETSRQNHRVQISLRGSNLKKSVLHVQSVSNWAPANVGPYSQAIEVQGKLHMAGAIALVPSTMSLAENQVAQCFTNMTAVAGAMGYQLENEELMVVYYTGEKPEIPRQFSPFFVKTTRIPKDGTVEVELHLKKSLPPLQTTELHLDAPSYRATLRTRHSPDVLYMVLRLEITHCSDPTSLLTAVKSHLDAYYSSIEHRSATKEEELMASGTLRKTVLDYITEVRAVGERPEELRTGWVEDVPSVGVYSQDWGLLVCVEDRLQLGTFDFMQASS